LDQAFVLEVLRYVYRWHFDQSYLLGADKVEKVEVWSRRLHPKLDQDDSSEYAEMWLPTVKTALEAKGWSALQSRSGACGLIRSRPLSP
jgi:hypothetical protein